MKNINLKFALWQQVLVAMALGVIAGLVLGTDALLLKPLGTAYINAIKMLVIPLVFFSLILSVTSLGQGKGLGRIASKTVGLFLLTALVMLTVTLSVVGLPLEGIAFIAAIDRIVDMIRTTTNVTGDTMVALVVAEQEGLLTGSVAQNKLEDDSVFAKALAETLVSCEIRS